MPEGHIYKYPLMWIFMSLGIRPICPKLNGFQWLLSKDFFKIPFLGVCDSLLGVTMSAQEFLHFNLMLPICY